MRRAILLLIFTMCSFGTVPDASAQAQLGTGSIGGTVEDTSGAVLPGATVTVTNAGTGLVRSALTNEAGQFNVGVLPPGNEYRVRVTLDAFAPVEQVDVTVNVGRTTALRLRLPVGGLTDTVTVSGESPVIDSTKTEETFLIDRRQINDLPINGRRADQFALLAPGVTRDGRFGLLSYRGQSGVFNNFTLEGNDDNQAYFAEARGRNRIASNISANAIQEFQVGLSNFLPEFGRSAGGSINAVIRSGSNQFRGDGFYYFRNASLNARDPLSTIKPKEKREQFGGSFSGPMKRDKLFFFFNYDQQLRNFPLIIEDLSGVLTGGLPSNPTAADLQAFDAGTDFLREQFPGGAPGNTIPRTANQNLVLGKVDWHATRSNTLSITHNYLNARGQNAIQTPLVLGNVGRNGTDDVRINSFNTRLTTIVNPRAVNEFRFQASRNHEFQFANQPPPQVFVGGFSFGRASFLERPALPDERRLQLVNNFSYTAGRHMLKFGVDVNRVRNIIDNPANFGGSYTYTNALTFGRDLLNPAGQNYSSYTQSFGLPGLDFSTIDYAVFAQDQWRTRKLTVNYGLRYDYQDNPSAVAPNPDVPETSRINRDRTNFGPRLGVAYDVGGDGRTVVRSGYGVYYGRTPNGTIQSALLQTGLFDPTRSTVGLSLTPGAPSSPVYPDILGSLPAEARGSTSLFTLGSDFRRPRMQEFNLGVERELIRNLAVSASFVYTKGDRLPVALDANLPAPQFTRLYQLPDGNIIEVPFSAGVTRTAAGVSQNINLSRPNPNFGSISQQGATGQTWYRALLVEVKRRFAEGSQFNVAYTLAKTENLSGSGNGGGAGSETPFAGSNLFNQFARESNRAAAPTDQRHRLVLNGIVNLPYRFRMSGIFTAESGRPYSAGVTVPNIPFALDGVQYNGFGGLLGQGGGADRNLAPNIERNSDYGDANYRTDLRVARDFRIKGSLVAEVVAEGFNIFNRSNFNGFRSTLYEARTTTATTPLAAPIVLTERTDYGLENNNSSQPDGTNARRFQLALRFRF
ncbi:MAG: TonB-dependent receptor [Acidobacteria bacterium]|nr:TonB-dependent receptor [Acidobacteriota bacterium]